MEQGELDFDEPAVDRCGLMTALNAIKPRYCRGSVELANADLPNARRRWVRKQCPKMPNYTTSWKDLPVARAS